MGGGPAGRVQILFMAWYSYRKWGLCLLGWEDWLLWNSRRLSSSSFVCISSQSLVFIKALWTENKGNWLTSNLNWIDSANGPLSTRQSYAMHVSHRSLQKKGPLQSFSVCFTKEYKNTERQIHLSKVTQLVGSFPGSLGLQSSGFGKGGAHVLKI